MAPLRCLCECNVKFIDQAKIIVSSGKGGQGSRHFRREKHVPRGGPDGGDGGRGGDVVLIASNRARSLYDFHHKRRFNAEAGAPGSEKRSTGRSGITLELVVPPGTAVYDDANGELIGELLVDGDRLVVASGGNGGWGNWHFKTATRQAPDNANPGLPGQTLSLRLELRLLADVALVGFPNAGKSTLIRAVSASKAEVADYPFTTITPNLGVVRHRGRSFTMADVPGLVAGAADGAGLGHQFLRHVERCGVLTFVLDPTSAVAPVDQYTVLRRELAAFDTELNNRAACVMLGKADTLGDAAAQTAADLAAAIGGVDVGLLSGASGDGIARWLDGLLNLLPVNEVVAGRTSDWSPLRES
jgi:GTPase